MGAATEPSGGSALERRVLQPTREDASQEGTRAFGPFSIRDTLAISQEGSHGHGQNKKREGTLHAREGQAR